MPTVPSQLPSEPGALLKHGLHLRSTRKPGDDVTSVTINGEPLDPEAFLPSGHVQLPGHRNDNFRVFTEGTNTKDSGLVDRDAWIKYLGEQSQTAPIAPDFARRSVEVIGNPARVGCQGYRRLPAQQA